MSKLCIIAIRIEADAVANVIADPIVDLTERLREEMRCGRPQKPQETTLLGVTAEMLIFYREHPDAN